MKALMITTVALVLTASTAAAAGTSGKSGFFRTPNKSIYCGYGYGGGSSFLVCGIRKGFLKPKPKNNCAKFGVDYVGNRIGMTGKGKAHVQACAGDAGPFADPAHTKVLPYGKTWKGGPFHCKAKRTILKCRSKSGHGFSIRKNHHYRVF
jgi:hypothetical protein